jgi:diadenosine tetraphosphate (Ap4A) HIT family hydrolase
MQDYVDIKETRSQTQLDQYLKINRDGTCPFCMEHFAKYHPGKTLNENEHWLITENENPYEGAKFHFLLVYKKSHIISPDEMPEAGMIDLFKIIKWANTQHNIDSGAFIMRYGGPGNGSSVRHLHAHIVVGPKNEKTENKIKVKVGYY